MGRRITAIKNVTLAEDVFLDHFIAFPILPGSMLIEALAHAGSALLEVSARFKKKALLIMVEQAKFRSFVQPGDQLWIELNILSQDERAAQMDGFITVAERKVVTARVTFTLQDPARFYTAKTRHLMETLYDIWLQNAEIIDEQGNRVIRDER